MVINKIMFWTILRYLQLLPIGTLLSWRSEATASYSLSRSADRRREWHGLGAGGAGVLAKATSVFICKGHARGS